jgi:hypothetical protein
MLTNYSGAEYWVTGNLEGEREAQLAPLDYHLEEDRRSVRNSSSFEING